MTKSEIVQFKVYRAEAEKIRNGLTIRLWYPETPERIERRLPENLNYGCSVLETLLNNCVGPIADEQNPIKPASGGVLPILEGGAIIINRRNARAPTHSLWHSLSSGYPQSIEAVYTADGLMQTALREGTEECLFVTNEEKPWLVVPRDSAKEYALTAARNLQLDLPIREVDVETIEGPDVLEVYNSKDALLFRMPCFLSISYESSTNLNMLFLRKYPLAPGEVRPVDGEGKYVGDKFENLNREAYVIPLQHLHGKLFGSTLENPAVYQSRLVDGRREIFVPAYSPPFQGPDRIHVKHPHVFGPDDLLVRMLDGIGIHGYAGNWMKMELEKTVVKRENKPLLPTNVLA